jgi:hypothetical protein
MARRAFLGVDCRTQSTKCSSSSDLGEVPRLWGSEHKLVERADGTREQDPD